MTREQRRRLLLRAHAAGKRFCKKAEADPYFRPATDAFVAGWLLGYRARRRDTKPRDPGPMPNDYERGTWGTGLPPIPLNPRIKK